MGHTNTEKTQSEQKPDQKYRQKSYLREYETYTHIIMGGKKCTVKWSLRLKMDHKKNIFFERKKTQHEYEKSRFFEHF